MYRFIISGLTLVLVAIFMIAISEPALANKRPNFLIIQTDDQDRASAYGNMNWSGQTRRRPIMPQLQALIAQRGASWNNYQVSSPICSPSRAALLSGQLGHNNRVAYNDPRPGEAIAGGWPGWKNSPAYEDNFVTRLDRAGYQTAHFGKFFNHYNADQDPTIPPGWDTWFTDGTDDSTRDYYGYYQLQKSPGQPASFVGPIGSPEYQLVQNTDSRLCSLQPQPSSRVCSYHSDYISRLAIQQIKDSTGPFLIQVGYHAWHGDHTPPSGAQPASRHRLLANNNQLPKDASWNEADIADKPSFIQQPLINYSDQRLMENFYRRGVESLQAVDEGVKGMIDALRQSGQLNNTYIIYLSDNGFFLGGHRLKFGKGLAYQQAARLPLLIRGPGIQPGREVNAPASTTDIAPAILNWAGVDSQGLQFDGPSLQQGLRGQVGRWRPLWISTFSSLPGTANKTTRNKITGVRYQGVRLGPYKYINYINGGEELYDLRYDRDELESQVGNPGYQQLLEWMRQALQIGASCQGAECYQQMQPPETSGWQPWPHSVPLGKKRQRR